MTNESSNSRDGDERLREENRTEDQRVHVEHSADFFGIFDAHHPPADDRISDCVHCGFCLPTCPTYALWGEEMDSPRGRVYLMKLGKEGAVPLDDTYVQHFDACLGCMACVTACPSGSSRTRPGCAPPPSWACSTNARAVTHCSSAAGCASDCRRDCRRSRS